MRLLSIAIASSIASLGLLASSNNAQAATFNFGTYGLYDITTFSTSYNADTAQLSSQPWFTNSSEAQLFANTVGSYFGYPNTPDNPGRRGPYFAYSTSSTTIGAYAYVKNQATTNLFSPVNKGNLLTYAIATPVPEPSEVLGTLAFSALGTGYLLKRQLKKRKHSVSATIEL